MLTKIISGNPINTGSAVEYVTQFGVIHSTDAKYQRGLKQYGQHNFSENSQVYVPISGGTGLRNLVSGVSGRQLTVDEFSFSASGTSNVSFFSSGSLGMELLSGPFQTVAGSMITGGPFRTRASESLVIRNDVGVIGGSLTYRIE
jgi:hypothetical protein